MSMVPHRVLGRFFNRPLLITPAAADTIGSFLLGRIGDAGGIDMRRGGGSGDDARESRTLFEPNRGADGTLTVHTPAASRFHGDVPLSEDGTRRPLPFRRTAEGVAIITLVGEWVNRGGWVGASSGVISYEGFAYQLEQAKADPRTRAVLLDMESPGGEAVGAFEAAAAVRQLTAVKPVWALVNGLCASAAYAIASAATRIVSIPTGISGSIGVVLAHFDMSEFLKKEGIKPTFIHAGAHKVDANPYQALPEAVRDRLQAEVGSFYDLFIQTVAAGRPSLSADAIRATGALTFMGADALRLGLVDELGSFESALAGLAAGGRTAPTARPVAAPAPGPAATTSNPAAPAATAPQQEKNVTDQEAEQVRASERARFRAIMDAPEAKGREAQARELAFNTSLTPETAIAILKAAPPGTSGDAAAFLANREAETPLALEPTAPVSTGEAAKAERYAASTNIVDRLNAGLPQGAIIPGRLGEQS
ncbi:S49 family peptidase [Methylobacterium sp. 391_Methyba4]|uniref:S49 family peptidase n=1 Tax=Methylobacterium sp. 391_Methyba4 TaxID=3038924 RepID=UPI00241E1C75|nr:S49 family peptidase [Methylobacterium sp. 391_Methyba4]WFS07623.1 S49 family peptidase [Methylobacterium sp. 391_Methyba4]